MKKYIGFILTFLFSLLFIYTSNDFYQRDNKDSLAGQYIADNNVSAGLAFKEIVASGITDPKAKKLEIINIQRLKKEAANPPGEINKWAWTKNYIFNHFFGQMAFTLSLMGLVLSFAFYIKFYIEEKDKQLLFQKHYS